MSDTPTAEEWLANVTKAALATVNAAGIEPPEVDGVGTVTPPADLTGCTCGDLTIEGRHRFDGTPCPH